MCHDFCLNNLISVIDTVLCAICYSLMHLLVAANCLSIHCHCCWHIIWAILMFFEMCIEINYMPVSWLGSWSSESANLAPPVLAFPAFANLIALAGGWRKSRDKLPGDEWLRLQYCGITVGNRMALKRSATLHGRKGCVPNFLRSIRPFAYTRSICFIRSSCELHILVLGIYIIFITLFMSLGLQGASASHVYAISFTLSGFHFESRTLNSCQFSIVILVEFGTYNYLPNGTLDTTVYTR